MKEERARPLFKLGPGQRKIWDAWDDDSENPTGGIKTYVGCAGEQGGKTRLGALWFKRLVKRDMKKNYIVGFPTYKIGKQATKPAVLKKLRGLGQYYAADDIFVFKEGGTVYFRSSTDVDSIVGIASCAGAYLDEAGKMPRQFYYNVESRVARCRGPVLITTTPYGLGWLYRDLIRKATRDHDPSILYSRWPSNENPTYPQEEFERLRRILPMQVFKRRLEGIHEKLEGLIFPEFGEDNLVDGKLISLDASTVYGGIDWGFNHAFALSLRAISKSGECYGIGFFKGSGLSTSQQIELVQAKTKLFKVKCWYAGHDRPDMIVELNNRGVPVMKYFEGYPDYREIDAGNQKLSELIRTRQYKVFREATHLEDLIDEYESYRWDVPDNDEEKPGKQKPVQLNDDLMSAERYVTTGTISLLTVKAEPPVIPLSAHTIRDTKWNPKRGGSTKSWDAY